MHLGPVRIPLEERFPRYDDHGDNFYYDQEDYLRMVQKRRKSWSYNIIRPNAINGFAPHGQPFPSLSHTIYYSTNIQQQTACPKH